MALSLQEGIYYRKKPKIGNSLCIISLRAEKASQISEIGGAIAGIWDRIIKLKKGITADIDIDPKHRKNGNLSVLLAYGPRLFEMSGSKRTRPASFTDNWNFKAMNGGGGPILDGSDIKYSTKVFENHLLDDHILLQFIADNEFYTNRAVVEVWNQNHKLEKDTGRPTLRITGLYTGFQRPDKRNWLGFHDSISNLKSNERPYVITIDSKQLGSQDKWMQHGTYLAFMRLAVDLEKWNNIGRTEQEIMIGRDKLTGCPLEIDNNGKPAKVRGCPIPGTSEVIDPGNERFREHPPYSKILQFSHVGRTRPIDRVPVFDKKSFRIFRQGFEFLIATQDYPGFIPGLNFVSFQNTPERLFRTLTYQSKIIQSVSKPLSGFSLDKFISVSAAGIFLVPPVAQNELFPGAQIFFNNRELRNIKGLKFAN